MNINAFPLAQRGFHVFPLVPGGKRPLAQGWQATATADPLDAMDCVPDGCNVGVSTSGLFVLDVDAGKGGLDELERLFAGRERPHTFTVRSASGGLHIYFRPVGETYATRAFRIMPDGRKIHAIAGFDGIDVRAEGGLVVGPGSTFNGKPYTVEVDAPLADLPPWLGELAKGALPRLVDRMASVGDLDTPNAIARAIDYLKTAEPAVEGNSGDAHTIVVANRVLDEGLSVGAALELMLEYWDHRCSPPWGDDLEAKVASAAKSRQEPIGSKNWDNLFAELPPPVPPAPAPVSSILEFPRDVCLAEIVAQQSRDIVRGMISPGALAVMYGDSGAGKSFVALHLAYAVALPAPGPDQLERRWAGRRVVRSPVLYCALEGVDGFRKRMVASAEHYGDAGDYFARYKLHPSLAHSEAGAKGAAMIIAAAATMQEVVGGKPGLIVIDTLARATAGDDENDAALMMAFVEHRASAIARATGWAVLIIHHTNKGGGMRGSGALKGAVDCQLRIEKVENGRGELIAEKVKDGPEGPLFSYRLKQVSLGVDDDGEAITSCIVEATEKAETNRECGAALIELIDGALSSGIVLSPSPHARNYAPKWAFENRGHFMFVYEDFVKAFSAVLPGYQVERYDNRGKPAQRLVAV